MDAAVVAEWGERLPPEPSSVGRSRRAAAAVLVAANRAELIDCATLLVSELVTNAILHAGTELDVRIRLTETGLRVEVGDGSPMVPGLRQYRQEASTGRGLALVEELSGAWGVDIVDDVNTGNIGNAGAGKVVWFELGSGDATPSPAEARSVSLVPVRLLHLSPALVQVTLEYGDAMLRELALISLDGDPEAAAPESVLTPECDLGPLMAAVGEALAEGRGVVDIEVGFPPEAAAGALDRLALIDEADRLAREERLLTLPAVPEVAHCRRWLLGQIAHQAGGGEPTPWRLPGLTDLAEPDGAWTPLTDEELREIQVEGSVVVADDSNRIIHVGADAADLLGWTAGDLVGRRLATIVPPALREAHLAGYTRFQLTGVASILSQVLHLPALRRDGTEVPITLEISSFTRPGGRQAFRAILEADAVEGKA